MGTYTKKPKLFILSLLLLIASQVFGGTPNWNRVDYTNSTTFVGIVKIIQYTPSFGYTPVAGDYIGAFVGNECRMIAQIFANGSDLYVSSVIQGGDNCAPGEPNCTAGGSETVTFRLWSNVGGKEYASIKGDTLTYPGSNIGSTSPYVIGKPKTGNDLLTLSVANVTLSPAFSAATTSYSATVTTLPIITDYTYTSSNKSTVIITNATKLNGTPAEATTTITVTSESGVVKTYTIVYSSSCTISATAPTVTPISPNICIGKSTTYTASGTGTSFSWYSDAAATTKIGTGTTLTVTPTSNTTYYVNQSSSATCISPVANVNVKVNSLPTILATATPNTICIGKTSVLSASGAISYLWSPSSGIVTPTISTTYLVTGTDVNGCTNTSSVSVKVNYLPSITASANPIAICIGSSTTISATSTGTGMNYIWNPSSGIVNPTSSTSYYVTGTDANGCSNTGTVAVKVNGLPSVVASANSASICLGSSSTISASGATSYIWDNTIGLATSKAVTPSVSTTYTVTGTDINGCSNTNQVSISVTSPTLPTSKDNAININDAIPPFTAIGTLVTWKDSTGVKLATGNAFTPTVSSATANVFKFLVTNTVNGCESAPITVKLYISSCGVSAPSVDIPTETICKGDAFQTITASGTAIKWYSGTSVVATTASYTPTVAGDLYVSQTIGCESPKTKVSVIENALPNVTASANIPTICNGNSVTLTSAGANNYVWANNVGAGNSIILAPNTTTTYSVTGTDLNNCKNTASIIVKVNPLPTIVAIASLNSICVGTLTTISVSGTTSYTWDNGVGLVSTKVVSPSKSTNYSVTGTDINNCKSTSAVTVIVNALPTINATASPASLCIGASSLLNVNGANTYVWDNGVGTVSSKTILPTATKTYNVTGTSTEGCSNTGSIIVTVNQLPTITAATTSNSICNGSSTLLSVSGGSSYLWDNGLGTVVSKTITPTVNTTYTVTGTDANGCSNISQTVVNVTTPALASSKDVSINVNDAIPTLTASGNLITWKDSTAVKITTGLTFLPTVSSSTSNVFKYLVTNTINGCESSPITVKLTVSSCTLTAPTVDKQTESICKGDSYTAITASGTSIKWYNGSNVVATSATYTPVSAGDLYVSQTSGCESPKTKVTVIENALPIVTASATPKSICAGSATLIEATGANTFTWNNAIGTTSSKSVSPNSNATYTVTGIDANGCKNTANISVIVNQLPTVMLSASPSTICEGQSSILTASGTTSYMWDNMISNNSSTVNPSSTTTYSVTGVDVNGCKNSAQGLLIVNPLPIITANLSLSTICKGESTTISAIGGSNYSWDNAIIGSSSTISPLKTTVYSVTGTDSKGVCKNTATVTLTVNQLPTIVASATPLAICNGNSSTISAIGATTYTWDNAIGAIASKLVSPITTTVYTVTGTDINGCKNSAQTTVTVTTPTSPTVKDITITVGSAVPTITTTSTNVKWFDANGNLITTSNSFVPSISTAISAPYIFKASSTLNGCESQLTTFNVIVSSCTIAAPTLDKTTLSICKGEKFGTITATGSNIKWYDSNNNLITTTGNSFTPTVAGDYYATQTNTCESPRTKFTAVENDLPVVSLPSLSAVCQNDKPITIASTQTGGIFSGVGITPNGVFTPSTFGTFTISYNYTDTKTNCSNTASTSIKVNSLPVVVASADKTQICSGSSSNISASGADNYTWNNAIGSKTSFSIAPTQNITYSVTGTDINGCQNVSSVAITVNAIPTPLTATGNSVCDGNTGTLTATGATGIVNWYNSKSSTSIASSSTITVSVADVYKVTQTVNGCESTPTPANFIVNARPSAVAISNVTINSGDTLKTVNASQVVNWYDNNKTLLSTKANFIPSISNTTLKAYTFYVDVTAPTTGCTSLMTSFVYEVKSSSCPSAPSVSSATICQGETGTITASGNNIKWYTVATGGISISTSTSYTVTASGIYYASQSNSSCESQRTMAEVVVNPIPTVTIDAPLTMKNTDAPIVITGNPIGGILSGNNILYSKFDPSASVIGNKTITYSFTNGFGCSASISKTILVTDGSKNLANLVAAISDGSTKLNTASTNGLIVKTPSVGQYPQASADSLNTILDKAIAVRDAASSTQAQIDAQTVLVTAAIKAFENSQIKAGDKTALNALITKAQGTSSSAVIGTAVGNYPSKADITAAITAATLVNTDSKATQSQVDAAVTALQAALTAFEKTKITAVAATSVTLSTTTTISLKVGESQTLSYTLFPANSAANLVWTSSDPNAVTVDQNGKITVVGTSNGNVTITVALANDLTRTSKVTVSVVTGINDIEFSSPEIYPTLTSDVIYVKNAANVKTIQIISAQGKIVQTTKTKADVVMLDITELNAGTFVVILTLENDAIITKEIVKQ